MAIKYVFNPFTQKFDAVDIAASAFVPTFIASTDSFNIPQYTQALFNLPIEADGVIDGDGVMVEVD